MSRTRLTEKQKATKRLAMAHYPLWIHRWTWAKFMAICKLKGRTARGVLEDLIEAYIKHNSSEGRKLED